MPSQQRRAARAARSQRKIGRLIKAVHREVERLGIEMVVITAMHGHLIRTAAMGSEEMAGTSAALGLAVSRAAMEAFGATHDVTGEVCGHA